MKREREGVTEKERTRERVPERGRERERERERARERERETSKQVQYKRIKELFMKLLNMAQRGRTLKGNRVDIYKRQDIQGKPC